MEKRIINPWQWQDERSYNQGVEVKQIESTLYCAGQAAVHPDGTSSDADMRTQLLLAIHNLEQVVSQAGFELKNIARLNVYTTNHPEFFSCFDIFTEWIAKNEIKQVSTVVEVKTLFETLSVELEATLVK
ncbi:RidA family protein [Dyadobacter arcticus]|uniref:Enamine deaminase RidA (YjgF/YER057c/UK114 family) n=1 Tax=Dyadobacter arcticus TaxID=1078754 RepID=A0ABX0USI5_9BACT|nr:RidA family protein [Dyadobacter arcticus]NIJ54720.1 enamine deaminase RidA (YjgF/YER057c/UK114 family) [Dyadobacter arcticus]